MTSNVLHKTVSLSAAALAVSGFLLSGSFAQAETSSKKATISPIEIVASDTNQDIRLPLGKARIIELPVSVRDVLVAQPGIADVVVRTPRKLYLMGRAIGSTNAFFFDDAGKEILRLEITVNRNDVVVKKTLDELLPDAEINVNAVDNTVFLTGTVRSAETASKAAEIAGRVGGGAGNIVNLLNVLEDQQVLLQVKIAEVSRRVLKELGINLSAALTAGDFALRVATGAASGTAFGQGTGSYVNGSDSIASTISALEQNGLVRTLAEPNLTAISGETANFLAGGSFPVPIGESDGRISISMQPFGVSLNFTPVVLNSGRISLRILTEVSDRDAGIGFTFQNGSVVPGTRIRRAETTVEMPSGGSMMLAGMFQEEFGTNISGLPGVKDVPVLGGLFRTNKLERVERELVVIVTSTLVKPIRNRQDLLDPTEGLIPPSDYDLYALGRIQGTYGRDHIPVVKDIKGPIGYIVK